MSGLPTLGGTTASSGASSVASATGSASSDSGSASQSSAAGSNTLTNAPALSTADSSNTLTNAPALTSSSGGLPGLSLTGLPTLSGAYSYPPPSVPPTAGAPYMHKTNLPENFVFIIVGAIIAFVALLIISWRVLTSWSINRRFKRDAGHGASYTPLADFKQKPAVQSSHDMKDLGNLPKSFSSVPSLFFSPTAEVARHSMRPASKHSSGVHQHMPAGHYRDASGGGR